MLFGAGLVAGLLGTIGHALNSHAIKHAATIAAWALPFEALYQDGLRLIARDETGLTGFLLQLGPFGGALRPRLGDPRLGGRLPRDRARARAARVPPPRPLRTVRSGRVRGQSPDMAARDRRCRVVEAERLRADMSALAHVGGQSPDVAGRCPTWQRRRRSRRPGGRSRRSGPGSRPACGRRSRGAGTRGRTASPPARDARAVRGRERLLDQRLDVVERLVRRAAEQEAAAAELPVRGGDARRLRGRLDAGRDRRAAARRRRRAAACRCRSRARGRRATPAAPTSRARRAAT